MPVIHECVCMSGVCVCLKGERGRQRQRWREIWTVDTDNFRKTIHAGRDISF